MDDHAPLLVRPHRHAAWLTAAALLLALPQAQANEWSGLGPALLVLFLIGLVAVGLVLLACVGLALLTCRWLAKRRKTPFSWPLVPVFTLLYAVPPALLAYNWQAVATQYYNVRGHLVNVASKDAYGRTELYHAIAYRRTAEIGILIARGADVNVADNEGQTPLIYTFTEGAEAGRPEVVAQLLAHQADPRRADRQGVTALHLAARHHTLAPVRALLAAGVDVNARTKTGVTPLVEGLSYTPNAADLTQVLLDAGADVTPTDGNGDSALHLAAQGNGVAVCQLLLAHHADPQARNREGKTPRALATDPAVQQLLDTAARAPAHEGQRQAP